MVGSPPQELSAVSTGVAPSRNQTNGLVESTRPGSVSFDALTSRAVGTAGWRAGRSAVMAATHATQVATASFHLIRTECLG